MLRLGFVLWPLGIVLVAIGLFQIKYSVQEIDREIRVVDQKLESIREYQAVLETEWEYRTQPAALEALASRHLGLKGDMGTIVTSLDRLPYRAPTDPNSMEALPWQSGFLSEYVQEAPAVITPQIETAEPLTRQLPDSNLDDLQSLISELEAF